MQASSYCFSSKAGRDFGSCQHHFENELSQKWKISIWNTFLHRVFSSS